MDKDCTHLSTHSDTKNLQTAHSQLPTMQWGISIVACAQCWPEQRVLAFRWFSLGAVLSVPQHCPHGHYNKEEAMPLAQDCGGSAFVCRFLLSIIIMAPLCKCTWEFVCVSENRQRSHVLKLRLFGMLYEQTHFFYHVSFCCTVHWVLIYTYSTAKMKYSFAPVFYTVWRKSEQYAEFSIGCWCRRWRVGRI